ncbi:MAG: peptidoglycan DD-metalloendopeptidase family protein [Solobacterium sp.]|nr:peptidoglycan DD-metalloendopeptidase family protein [Solobacterium sp.]
MINQSKIFNKALKWLMGNLAIVLVLMSILTAVITPFMWVNNMLGNITEFFGHILSDDETIEDYREVLDDFGSTRHLAFSYSEIMACSMNEKYTKNIQGCIDHIKMDGSFDKDVDISMAITFRPYIKVDEYKGLLTPYGYKDLWIPTLYEKDHYKKQATVSDSGETIEEWVLDYTEDKIYEDICNAKKPETACRVTREGSWVYPYVKPSNAEIKERYGFYVEEDEEDTINFMNGVKYGSGDAIAISTGRINEVGDDYVILEVEHNGLSFEVKYSGLKSIKVKNNQKVEQGYFLGNGSEITVQTYMDEEKYFNPTLLFGNTQNLQFTSMDLNEIHKQIAGLESKLTNLIPTDGWTYPTPGVPVNPYAGTWFYADGGVHLGADYAGPLGSDVVAAGNGLILNSANGCPYGYLGDNCGNQYGGSMGGGNQVFLLTKVNGGTYIVHYCHLLLNTPIARGTIVKAGDKIGEIGSSGNSTGPHCHIEVKYLGPESKYNEIAKNWNGDLSFGCGYGVAGLNSICDNSMNAPCRIKPESIFNE